MSGCICSKFDTDSGRYYCDVSGDQCVYLIPNSKQCADDYGEGPDAEDEYSNNSLTNKKLRRD